MQVQLNLALDEANQILVTLAKRPYEEVFTLIQKIQAQVSVQVNGQTSPVQKQQEQQSGETPKAPI